MEPLACLHNCAFFLHGVLLFGLVAIAILSLIYKKKYSSIQPQFIQDFYAGDHTNSIPVLTLISTTVSALIAILILILTVLFYRMTSGEDRLTSSMDIGDCMREFRIARHKHMNKAEKKMKAKQELDSDSTSDSSDYSEGCDDCRAKANMRKHKKRSRDSRKAIVSMYKQRNKEHSGSSSTYSVGGGGVNPSSKKGARHGEHHHNWMDWLAEPCGHDQPTTSRRTGNAKDGDIGGVYSADRK